MPPEPFLIREATTADIPEITAIYGPEVASGIASFEEIAPSEAEMALRLARTVDQGLPYIVAERQGTVLGYAYAGLFHQRAAYRYTLEDTVYIHPGARRQGVARSLVENLIARCEAIGCRQMIALITYSPDSPSIALHKALSFDIMGIAQAIGFKFGRWLDMTYMQRAIGASDSMPPDRPILGPMLNV